MYGTVPVDRFSFPSGHSSRCFTIAILGSLTSFSSSSVAGFAGLSAPVFPSHPHLFTGVLWGWAFSVSLSRVCMGRHHVLDVIFGFLFAASQSLFLSFHGFPFSLHHVSPWVQHVVWSG
eukprot:Sdes_comp20806_c0_seq2m17160